MSNVKTLILFGLKINELYFYHRYYSFDHLLKDSIMKIAFNTCLVCLLSVFTIQSGIEAQALQKLAGPYGGGDKVYEGKNGVLFQLIQDGTDYNILFKSVDGGVNWIKMPATPSHWSTKVEVGANGNLYCANSNKLYKSTDDGLSWSPINWPTTNSIQTISALSDGTIFAATYNKLYKTINNGVDWQISAMNKIDKVFYNANNDKTYAISQDTLFVSKDKGISWQVSYVDNFGFGNTIDKNFLIAADGSLLVSGEDYIWKFDATGNFSKKIDPANEIDSRQMDMTLSPTGRLFAAKWNNTYYSDDLGENWLPLILTGVYPKAFRLLTFTTSGLFFGVRDYGSLYRSTDYGKTWIFSARGLNYAAMVQVDFISESKILALTSDGLFFSADAGQSWNYLIDYHGAIFPGFTTNRLVHYGEEFYLVDAFSLYYFKNANSIPVILQSATGLATLDYQLFVNPLTGSLFYVDFYQHFYKSTDKGQHWNLLTFGDLYYLYPLPDGSLLATTLNGIYKSSDDGENWNLVFSNGQNTFNTYPAIMGNTFSGAYIIYPDSVNYYLASTVDFGDTWNTQILDSISLNINLLYPNKGAAVNNLDYLYVAGFNDDIFRSVDDGRTFNSFSTVPGLADLKISPGQNLYALGDGLYRTIASTSSTKVLRGNVFLDVNKNCDQNNSEQSTANRLLQADNGVAKEYGFSRKNGDFSIPIESGDYQVTVVTDNNYWTSCDKTIPAANYNLNDTLRVGLQVNSLCPFMHIDVQSSILRRCFEAVLYLKYANTGTQKATNAFVEVTLDSLFEFVSSSIPYSSKNRNVYRFQLGNIDENTSGVFSIAVNISCNAKLNQIHCTEAHIYPDSSCVQTSQAIIRTNSICLGDSIDLIIRNDGNKAMGAAKNWLAIEESNNGIQEIDGGSFYLNAGQIYTKRIASRDRVLFMAEQDDSYPYNKSSRTEINDCSNHSLPGSPGLSIINEDDEEPYISRFCEPNVGSFDPNEIKGLPKGITDEKYIEKTQQLEYIIRFQNTGTDTAFNVRIENKIPKTELDLSTLTLGVASHPYSYLLDQDGKLIITFKNIFLSDSNINEKNSHGFIQYSIKPLATLSNGKKILNDAQIYFDFNTAVNTNIDLHTIGSPIPVKVNEVKQSNTTDFQIKPNPMQDFCTILINAKTKNEPYLLSCRDLYSRQMLEMHVTGNRTVISKGELKPGVYILTLKSANGFPISSHKLVIE